MSQAFVDRAASRLDVLRERFTSLPPRTYGDVVKAVVDVLDDPSEPDSICRDSIRSVKYADGLHGSYIFLIGSRDSKRLWFIRLWYGCGDECDSLMNAASRPNPDERLSGYINLAMRTARGLQEMA